MRLITCAGGARWEAPMIRGLQDRELRVEILRRCVDYAELLGIAQRDRPEAALVSAELPWLDRDAVATLQDSGVTVVAVESSPGSRPLERIGVPFVIPATSNAHEVVALLAHLDVPVAKSDFVTPEEPLDPNSNSAQLIAIWGAHGAPGRTTIAVHVAEELIRTNRRCLLIDGDCWAPSIAQRLALDETPSITNATHAAADGFAEPLEGFFQETPTGLSVLTGLPRADLWTEIREHAWRSLVDSARVSHDVVIVDIAAPIEEDEELAFDAAPFRRNIMSKVVLEDADEVFLIVQADPIGIRRAIFAYHQLHENFPNVMVTPILNNAPKSPRRLQDCSLEIERHLGALPGAIFPQEPQLEQAVWEGKTLHQVAPRSKWLRELEVLIKARVQ